MGMGLWSQSTSGRPDYAFNSFCYNMQSNALFSSLLLVVHAYPFRHLKHTISFFCIGIFLPPSLVLSVYTLGLNQRRQKNKK